MNNEEIEMNENGGCGTRIDAWWEHVDARALRSIAEVTARGALRYELDNWRAVSVGEHLRHAIDHAYKYLEPRQQRTAGGRDDEGELAHFACRAVMALAVFLQRPGLESEVVVGVRRKP